MTNSSRTKQVLAIAALCSMSILFTKIECNSEQVELLGSLNELLKTNMPPYEVMNGYLVEKVPKLFELKDNVNAARKLIGQDEFEQLIESDEFKELARLLASLKESQEDICSGENLSNLRKLAESMKKTYPRPTEGKDATIRLNYLLIQFGKRVYKNCLTSLQNEFFASGAAELLTDLSSGPTLLKLDTVLDFVKVIINDYNPNIANEDLFTRDIRSALDQLHNEQTKGLGNAIANERKELKKHLEQYLLSACNRMRGYLDKSQNGIVREVSVRKYVDLITMALIMSPQVIKSKMGSDSFQEIMLPGIGSVVVCNKLLAMKSYDSFVEKMIKISKAHSRIAPLRSKSL